MYILALFVSLQEEKLARIQAANLNLVTKAELGYSTLITIPVEEEQSKE